MNTRLRTAYRGPEAPIGFVHGEPVYPIAGSQRSGTHTAGDVLVNQTADGVSLTTVWNEFVDTLRMYNEHRLAIMRLLAFPTTVSLDVVQQAVSGARFELASEFGEPVGMRPAPDTLLIGYSRGDYDLAVRYTWRFLRDATYEQLAATHETALEGDNRHITERVQAALLSNTTRENEEGKTVFPLYNGDTFVPPPYLGKVHTAGHTHYLTTQGALGSSDLEDAIRHITHHGYGRRSGSQLLILANESESRVIQRFVRGETSGDGAVSSFDFVPSTDAPAFLTEKTIVGLRPPGEFGGLRVAGSLGPAWLVETDFMPAGYIAVVASEGPDSRANPVGFREHPNLAYRGLRILPGNGSYPLVNSFYSRTFGVGVRHRGAACVVQVTSAAVSDYTPPTFDLP
jgi:hypothetical protein